MNAGSTRQLCDTADIFFHFTLAGEHQISQLVNDDYNAGHFFLALCQGLIVTLDVPDFGLGKDFITVHHFIDSPL